MAAITSFHAEKCCHLLSEHEASAGAYAAASVTSRSIVRSYSCLRELQTSWMFCRVLQHAGAEGEFMASRKRQYSAGKMRDARKEDLFH